MYHKDTLLRAAEKRQQVCRPVGFEGEQSGAPWGPGPVGAWLGQKRAVLKQELYPSCLTLHQWHALEDLVGSGDVTPCDYC